MSVRTSNRDIDVDDPSEFIHGMDIEISPLEEEELPALQHRQQPDSEFWNLKWSADSNSVSNSRYGKKSDADFEDALHNSLRALNMDNLLEQNITLRVDDGETSAVYNTGFENIYEGMNFQISGGEMLDRISGSGPQSWVDHGEIEYFELELEDRKYVWEKGDNENHYGIMGRSPARPGDVRLFSDSWPSDKNGYMDLNALREQLQEETAEYGSMLE